MAEATFSLDLHVLGPPLTFALSQDQTLHRKFEPALRCRIVEGSGGRPHVQRGMVSVLQTRNPQSFERLAIQFSETDPARNPSLGRRIKNSSPCGWRAPCQGLDGVRRGSVLIRGAGRAVNADRIFFGYASQLFDLTGLSGRSNGLVARWFRSCDPVTLRGLPCSSA